MVTPSKSKARFCRRVGCVYWMKVASPSILAFTRCRQRVARWARRVANEWTVWPAVVLWVRAFASAGTERWAGATTGTAGFGVLVVEQQRRQRLAQVPLDVVGEHAEEDMRSDPLLEAVVDRPHLEVDCFQATKRAFGP